MELNHLLICWVTWVHLTTHPAACDFSCESLKTLLSLQATAASQLSGDWEAMHGSWGKATVESLSRQKLNWKLLPSLLCVVVLIVEVCFASPPHIWGATFITDFQFRHWKSWVGLEFLLAGIQGNIHMDNLTCSLNLEVFLKAHQSQTPVRSYSWGFWQLKNGRHKIKSLTHLPDIHWYSGYSRIWAFVVEGVMGLF